MTTLRIRPKAVMPELRQDVDIQLHRAWYEEQWVVVINLARKRYKATQDDYFKALEIAAMSYGDSPADHAAGREGLQTLVDDVKAVDIDVIELYEMAMHVLRLDFSNTIGVLCVRTVKASSRDKKAGIRCFHTCMKYSDWEHAQEIAVLLSKTFPSDRRLLFYNITATSLVAANENSSDMKKKLFPNLAMAHADRAFGLRPIGKDQMPPAQTEITEHDILLWIEIRRKFGSRDESLRLLSLPTWGPFYFLELGFFQAFQLSLTFLLHIEAYEEVAGVGKILLERAISIVREDLATVQASNDDQNDMNSTSSLDNDVNYRYVEASQNWAVLRTIVNSACHLPDARKVLKVFQKRLQSLERHFRAKGPMRRVCASNYDRILLEITFQRAGFATSDGEAAETSNSQVRDVIKLACEYYIHSASFNLFRDFLISMRTYRVAAAVNALQNEQIADDLNITALSNPAIASLRLRFMFFLATSQEGREECQLCNAPVNGGPDCKSCLKGIAENALEHYRLLMKDDEAGDPASDATTDALNCFVILGSICLLKLAGSGRSRWAYQKESPLYYTDIQLFLQAVAWLDFHYRKWTPTGAPTLMIVKLLLMMGCVSRALEMWRSFGVKNSLRECMEVYVLDRLASISPAHLMPGTNNFIEPILQYFDSALRVKGPEAMLRCLEDGHYVLFHDLLQSEDARSRNAVMILSVVEGRRGKRLKTGKTDVTIEDDALINTLTLKDELYDFTDYGILPKWEGPNSMSVKEMISYGPTPTHRRCHLSVLAERFLDLVSYALPKDFKASKAAQLQNTDWQTTASSLKALQGDMATLLYDESKGYANDLTDPERWHFRLVNSLATLVTLVLAQMPISAPSQSVIDEIVIKAKQVLRIMEYQTDDFLNIPDGIHGKMQTLHGVAALHAMGMLRESSLTMKHTTQYISGLLDRSKAKDKARGANDNAWLSAYLKEFTAATALADKRMKDRLKKLSDNVNTSGWVDRLVDWTYGDNTIVFGADREFKNSVAKLLAEIIPMEARETWAIDIADSWRENVKGWNAVKFD
ncbi:hypothetical protein GGR50DRAFT_692119 [Xylaria sp. CBS 124048]|nr:hypothetical protein GGR50DRAFT_692119 [Xylaria sp. CBS 124048]